MTTLRIVGIAPGLQYTGVAELVHDGHRCVSLTTWLEVTNPPPAPTDDQTAARMTRQIRAVAPAGERATCATCGHVDTRAPTDLVMVVLEAPALHAKDANADRNLGYWWRLRSIMVSRNIPVARCNPVHLKTWAAGHGRATDDMMKMALDRIWPGVLAKTDHEVDAALLALAGAQKLRWEGPRGPIGEPLRQVEWLCKMTWPRLPERIDR